MPSMGIISDPDLPDHLARNLADNVPDELNEQISDGEPWTMTVVRDPLTAGRHSGEDILNATSAHRRLHGWDYAVCLTDLPLRFGGRPTLADVSVDRDVGAISLPALGGVQPGRRARQMLLQVVDEMTGATEESREKPYPQRRRGLHSGPTEVLAPIRRERPRRDDNGIRYRATRRRGRLRLLSGMVRSNAPWRLVLGMSSALAASIGTSAFGMVSSVVWQIGDLLGPARKIFASVAVLALMVTWLILTYRLWDKRSHGSDREQAVLYNTSTVVTLSIGVSCLYLGLFVVNFAVGSLFLEPVLVASKLGHPVHVDDYLQLAWAATSMGVAAGALGSGLENDATVRQAAYGYREAQRRRQQQQLDAQEQSDRTG